MPNGQLDIKGLVSDPGFSALPPADQRKALFGVTKDKSFSALSDTDTQAFVKTFAITDPLTQRTQAAAPQTTTRPYFEKPPIGEAYPQANPIEKEATRQESIQGRAVKARNAAITPVTNAASMIMPMMGVEDIPSAARAGAKLGDVAKAMERTPVSLGKSKAAANAAVDVISKGGKSSKLVTDFLDHIGEGDSMTWKDARDFISNASSRSRLAELFEGQTGHARYAIGKFVGQLGEEIKSAAQAAGQGEDYGEALKEYRNAMRIARALKASVAIGGAAALKAMTTAKASSTVKSMWSALE